jgi:zinc transporter ZupT
MIMKNKRMLITGITVGILFIILDMVFAIVTSPIYSSYSNLPIWKNPPNVAAGIIFDIANGFILVIVYAMIYNGIPKTGWKKGLNYGVMVGLFRVLMSTFSTTVMYEIPLMIVVTNLFTGFLEIVVLCIMLSIIYEKKTIS